MSLARTLLLVLPVLPLEVIPGVRLSNLDMLCKAGIGGGWGEVLGEA